MLSARHVIGQSDLRKRRDLVRVSSDFTVTHVTGMEHSVSARRRPAFEVPTEEAIGRVDPLIRQLTLYCCLPAVSSGKTRGCALARATGNGGKSSRPTHRPGGGPPRWHAEDLSRRSGIGAAADLDDLGMRKLPHTAAEDLLEVIIVATSARPRCSRQIDRLTTGASCWATPPSHRVLDRPLHHAHVLKCGPRSCRTKVQTDFAHRGCDELELTSLDRPRK